MKNDGVETMWPTDENWIELLQPALSNDPDRAEMAARIWKRLLDLLKGDEPGVKQATAILNDALRLTYPYTSSHQLAFQHWSLWLSSGAIPPADEPERLLRESIERANAAIAKAKGRGSATEHRKKQSVSRARQK